MAISFCELYRKNKPKFVIKNDPFDIMAFEEKLAEAKDLSSTIDSGTRDLKSFAYLAVDLYSILFKADPKLQDPKLVRRDFHIHKNIIEQVMAMSQYRELRQFTKLSEFDSVIATDTLAKEVIKVLKNLKPTIAQQQKLADELEQLQDEMEQMPQIVRSMFSNQNNSGVQSTQMTSGEGNSGDMATSNSIVLNSNEYAGNTGISEGNVGIPDRIENSNEEQQQDNFTPLSNNQSQIDMSNENVNEDAELSPISDGENSSEGQSVNVCPPPADLDSIEDSLPDPLLVRRMQEVKERMEEIKHEFSELENSYDLEEIRQDLRICVSSALNNVTEMSDILAAWGTNDGEVQYMTFHERIALAEKIKNSRNLLKLAKMLGRYKRWAVGANKSRISQDLVEITTIDTDSDLTRILPSEMIQLADDYLALLFIRRYMEDDLLCYDVKAKAKEEEGPIVILIDESGSMYGDKELWSKAVLVALAEIARTRHRNFAVIEYSNRGRMRIHKFQGGKIGTNALIDLASHFFNGGTDYEEPLTAAMTICNEEGFQKADILMLTDGECYVTPQFMRDFLDLKNKLSVKVTSVCIDFGYSSTGSLSEFSDEIIPCSNFARDMDSVTQKIFEAV